MNQSGVASNQDRPLRGHNNISLMDVSYNNSSSSGGVSRRRPRTPQDMLFNSLSLSGRVHKISGGSSENSDDGKVYILSLYNDVEYILNIFSVLLLSLRRTAVDRNLINRIIRQLN